MTALNTVGKNIEARRFNLPGVEHLVKGPGKYDFLIGAVAERKTVQIVTGMGVYDLQVSGVDWISEDNWAFRGFVRRTSTHANMYEGQRVNGMVEGVLRLRPDRDNLRGFMHFTS